METRLPAPDGMSVWRLAFGAGRISVWDMMGSSSVGVLQLVDGHPDGIKDLAQD
jgi:hypothetical protein